MLIFRLLTFFSIILKTLFVTIINNLTGFYGNFAHYIFEVMKNSNNLKTKKMNNLKKQLRKQQRTQLSNFKIYLNDLTNLNTWQIKDYTTQRQRANLSISQLKKLVLKKKVQRLEKKYLENCMYLDSLPTVKAKEFKISIEWSKSRTWGLNPTAKFTSFEPFESNSSGSVSGCGYCKESTAFARAANKNKAFIYLLSKEKNRPKNKGKSNSQIFGYGVDGVIPHLSEGVGVSSFYSVCEAIGYKLNDIAHGKTFDAYTINK